MRALEHRHHVAEMAFHRHAFRLCGVAGVVSACALAGWLTVRTGLSFRVMAAIVLLSLAVFLVLAMARKIVTGEEALTYYHHQLTVLAAAAVLLKLLGQPILPYLDVTALGVGAFLAWGRCGCLLAGCCHGRPLRWGVTYGDGHVRAGFSSHLKGVRLFPLQAVESLAVLVMVAAGAAMVLAKSAPGSALAWYVVGYGLVRFCLEFARGDAERPYALGFSEAQWTSALLLVGVATAEYAGVLPLRAWHVGAAAALATTMIGLAIIRRRRHTPTHQLEHPRHVREFAAAVDRVSTPSAKSALRPGLSSAIPIAHTPLGIQISAGQVREGAVVIRHYTLSSSSHPMTKEAANRLAKLILRLRFPAATAEVVRGGAGVFHALIHVPPDGAQGSEAHAESFADAHHDGFHGFSCTIRKIWSCLSLK